MTHDSLLLIGRIICWSVLVAALSSCAVSYVDSRGAKHVVGLVKLTIEPEENWEKVAGESVSVQSVGVSVYSTPLNSGVVIGYNREILTAVRNDSTILKRWPTGAPHATKE